MTNLTSQLLTSRDNIYLADYQNLYFLSPISYAFVARIFDYVYRLTGTISV
ncbi:MAG: hypothetical protein R6U62_10290 [Bacteroidales bacterium]